MYERITKDGEATAAGAVKDYTFTSISKSGYVFLGVTEIWITAGQTVGVIAYQRQSASSMLIRTRNNGTASITPTSISIGCLFAKS